MSPDEALLDILACPDEHHSALDVVRDGTEITALTCPTCQRTFDVREGIPSLLL